MTAFSNNDIIADFNGDGQLTGADENAFLTAFTTCPDRTDIAMKIQKDSALAAAFGTIPFDLEHYDPITLMSLPTIPDTGRGYSYFSATLEDGSSYVVESFMTFNIVSNWLTPAELALLDSSAIASLDNIQTSGAVARLHFGRIGPVGSFPSVNVLGLSLEDPAEGLATFAILQHLEDDPWDDIFSIYQEAMVLDTIPIVGNPHVVDAIIAPCRCADGSIAQPDLQYQQDVNTANGQFDIDMNRAVG